MNPSKSHKNDVKKVFREKGTCSRTYAYLLNREFGNNKDPEECATDSMAGGLMQKGHQCGMLWGASLAVGAEAYRRRQNNNDSIRLAITATKKILESFAKLSNTTNCREITNCNMDNFFGLTKYIIKTLIQGLENSTCFKLAEEWYPKAIQSAIEGLDQAPKISNLKTVSCSTEVAKKMGASEEEQFMVAGFAGGLGLSGNACGALSAAIWMNSLEWAKENPNKSTFKNKYAKNTLKVFNMETNSEMLCHKICQNSFKTIDEHTQFIKNGGCGKLINILAQTSRNRKI